LIGSQSAGRKYKSNYQHIKRLEAERPCPHQTGVTTKLAAQDNCTALRSRFTIVIDRHQAVKGLEQKAGVKVTSLQ
jgi:hypothetical protein